MISNETMELVKKAQRYGFLRRPCPNCAQYMVVARSGKMCANCGSGKEES